MHAPLQVRVRVRSPSSSQHLEANTQLLHEDHEFHAVNDIEILGILDWKGINSRLPEPIFVTRLPKRVVTNPSLEFSCRASDSYYFGIEGWYESLLSTRTIH